MKVTAHPNAGYPVIFHVAIENEAELAAMFRMTGEWGVRRDLPGLERLYTTVMNSAEERGINYDDYEPDLFSCEAERQPE